MIVMKNNKLKKYIAFLLCAISILSFVGCSYQPSQSAPVRVDDKAEKVEVDLIRQDLFFNPEYPSAENVPVKEHYDDVIILNIIASPSETTSDKEDKEPIAEQKPVQNSKDDTTTSNKAPVVEEPKKETETPVEKPVEKPAEKPVEKPAETPKEEQGYIINPSTAIPYKVSVPYKYQVVIDQIMNHYNNAERHTMVADIDIDMTGLDLATLNIYFIESYFPYCYTDKIVYKANNGSYYYASKAIETNLVLNAEIKNDIRNITKNFNKGTEKEVLAQASAWVANHLTYTKNTSTLKEALYNKKAICHGYALLFKALCTELGIRCDYDSGHYYGEYHAWNIVYLNDGAALAYDITLNDSNRTTKWNAVDLSTFAQSHKTEASNYYEKIFS